MALHLHLHQVISMPRLYKGENGKPCSLYPAKNSVHALKFASGFKNELNHNSGKGNKGGNSKDVMQILKLGKLMDANDWLEQHHKSLNVETYACLLRACSNAKALPEGRRIHKHVIEHGFGHDIFLCSLVIEMYAKCGRLEDGKEILKAMQKRNVYSWTALIVGYIDHGYHLGALELFPQMQDGVKPDKIAFTIILGACCSPEFTAAAKFIQSQIIDNEFQMDVFIGTALISMYDKCKSLSTAVLVFENMKERNVVSWTSIITAHVQNNNAQGAFYFYIRMQLEELMPNKITFVSMLDACAALEAMAQGKCIHASIAKRELECHLVLATALINMYEDAHLVFKKMKQKNLVAWNAMITVYALNGYHEAAMSLFLQMHSGNLTPDKVTYLNILDACASISAVMDGIKVHAYIINTNAVLDMAVENALINMYAKSGSAENAQAVFDQMKKHDVVSWTTIIIAYGQHGDGKQALKMFYKMRRWGVRPNKITFVRVLSACRYAGLLDIGHHYLLSITGNYNFSLTLDHYGCMVELFCRGGSLNEAEDLLNNVPLNVSAKAWTSLLDACKNLNEQTLPDLVFLHLS